MRSILLVFHFIGLAMGLGTSLAFMFLGIASAKMEAAEAKKFMLNTFSLSRMGHIGLTLLILTGLFLMAPYWANLTQSPLLITKLVLVLVLGVLIGINTSFAKKVKQGEAAYLSRLQIFGRLSLLTTLAIVVLAVFNFS